LRLAPPLLSPDVREMGRGDRDAADGPAHDAPRFAMARLGIGVATPASSCAASAGSTRSSSAARGRPSVYPPSIGSRVRIAFPHIAEPRANGVAELPPGPR